MQRPSAKPNQASRPQPKLISPKPASMQTRKPSVPKIIRRGSKEPKTADAEAGKSKDAPVAETCPQILARVLGVVVQQLGFDESWGRLLAVVEPYITIKNLLPESRSGLGDQLIKEGSFIVYWLKLMAKNPYIVMGAVAAKINEKYLPLVENEKACLESYLQEISKQEKKEESSVTPAKQAKPTESLKKSILKNSEKKVQFGKDEIIYPVLETIKSDPQAKKHGLIEKVKQEQQILLRYFQIEEVLLLEQVVLSGVIKSYEGLDVVLVRKKWGSKEQLCLARRDSSSKGDLPLSAIQAVKNDYPSLAYLEMEGQDIDSAWFDSLPTDKVQ